MRHPGDRLPTDLRCPDLERFVLHCRRQGFAPNTVHGYAQVLKTLCRLGHRLGYIPEDITEYFEMPRVPKTIIPTFSDGQLQALLAVPDKRTWLGIRDRAILLVLLDTLIRVSESPAGGDRDLLRAVLRLVPTATLGPGLLVAAGFVDDGEVRLAL